MKTRLVTILAVTAVVGFSVPGLGFSPFFETARLETGNIEASDERRDQERVLEDRLREVIGRELSATAMDENGWTDLHWAAALNLPELAIVLLDAGARVNARLRITDFAAGQLQERLLSLLGHNLQVTNSETPLHVAAMSNSVDVAAVLIARGADVQARHWSDGGGWTPLGFAVDANAADIAMMLMDSGIVLGRDTLNAHLDHAAYRGSGMVVKLLVKRGADVNAAASFGRTPLQSAAYGGAAETASELIALGADVDAKDDHGMTPLHYAIWGHHYPSVETAIVLLEAGADIHAKDNEGRTPLHITAVENLRDLAEILIERGADVNARDNDGRTPLDVAIANNAQAVVAILRERQN